MSVGPGRARDLDERVAELLRGRHVSIPAGLALASMGSFVLELWELGSLRHRVGASAIVAVLLALALLGPRLERPFLEAARSRWSPYLVALVWAALLPIAQHSAALGHLAYVAGPYTACWWLARGCRPAYVISFCWCVMALALNVPALALLPAFAVLLRRRPTVAFGAVLGLGALLRVILSLAAPRPSWSPDSWGYVALAYQVLSGAPDLGTGFARPPYVSALLFVTLLIGGSHFAYVLASHAFGLAVAWYASFALRRRFGDLAGWQACAALAVCPELIVFEHVLLSEATFLAFLTVLSVKVLELRRDARPTVADAITLGLATGLVASARPVALLAPILVVAAACFVRWPWRRLLALTAACAAPLLIVCSVNLGMNGFFGVSSPEFRAYVWFSVTGHRVVLDSPLHAQIKAEMRPSIERFNERYPPWNPDTNSLIWAADSPLNTSRTLKAMPLEQQRAVIEDLAREAIAHDPVGFATRVAYQLVVRYLFAPREWNDGYVYTWGDVVEADQTRAYLPPSLAHLAETPALVRPFEGARLYSALYWTLLALRTGVGSPAYGHELFSIYKEPWILLAALLIGWRRAPRFRVAGLMLIALGAMMIVVTCVVQEPIARYRLQVHPIGVALVAIALAGRPGAPPSADESGPLERALQPVQQEAA